MPRQTHKNSASAPQMEPIELGSDRSFGFTMSIALGIIAWVCWIKNISTAPVILAVVSGGFLLLALWKPAYLHSANIVWMKFAHVLHLIISPVILALLFFGAFTPTALWIKLTQKDPLRLRVRPDDSSYWIDCSDEKSDLKKQF